MRCGRLRWCGGGLKAVHDLKGVGSGLFLEVWMANRIPHQSSFSLTLSLYVSLKKKNLGLDTSLKVGPGAKKWNGNLLLT